MTKSAAVCAGVSSGVNAAVVDSIAASPDRVLKAAAAARTTLGTRISRPFHIRQLMKSGVLTGQPVHCVSADGSTLTGALAGLSRFVLSSIACTALVRQDCCKLRTAWISTHTRCS